MRFTQTCHCLLLTCALTACPPVTPSPNTPLPLPDTFVAFERMAVFQEEGDSGQARARGLDGALPSGTSLEIWDEESNTKILDATGDANGRFDVRFGSQPNQAFVLIGKNGARSTPALQFRARVRRDGLSLSVNPRLAGTGSTPNQVVTPMDAASTGRTTAFLVVSGDNTLDNVDWDDGTRTRPLAPLPDTAGAAGPVAATPWGTVVRGGLAYVTRYGQGGVAVVDTVSGTVTAVVDAPGLLTLPTPLPLNPAADANGDGVPEDLATHLQPRAPTGVTLVGNTLLVTYSNVLAVGGNGRAQYAPGVIHAVPLDNGGRPSGPGVTTFTSFDNPVHVIPHPNGSHAIVSASGQLIRGDSTWTAETDGGLDILDAATLQNAGVVNLGRYAPSRPVVLPGLNAIYVPSVLQARLVRVDLTTNLVTRGPGAALAALELETTTALRSVFECVPHLTGLVFCGIFDSDALVAVDMRDDTVRPWPFTTDVPLAAAAGNLKLGVQSLAVRPGRNGVDRTGPDILVLLGLASRVATVDTRFILGP